MARYYGDFRSTDTSVDPKGKRYRVVIFTDFDGSMPYQYYSHIIWHWIVPELDYRRPINGAQLTMAETPFTVNYEGDENNVYKPYRCSTATVSFLQSDIDLNLINTSGTKTLVVLLKQKDEVTLTNGYYYNSMTGESLNKKVVYDSSHNIVYRDFEPYREDEFVFNVEWVGFSTPETFSMDYSHNSDVLTLNCQDALSVMKYSKYSWIGDSDTNAVVSFNDMLLNFLKDLGVYRKVYITDTLRMADVSTNILEKMFEQQANNFDEDEKAISKLDVLTQILTYLNLTAIPWKNTLIITTPSAIANQWGNYYVYDLPTNDYILNWSSNGDTYWQQPTEHINHRHAITADSYANGGMSISTTNTYNSVKVECDEYNVPMMLPDITDEKNLSNHYYHYASGVFYRSGNDAQRWYWEHDFWAVNIPRMKTYQYVGNSYNDSWGTAEKPTPNFSEGTDGIYYAPTCAILDDGGHTYSSTQADGLQKPYNPKRSIYFRTPSYSSTRNGVQNSWQTMLYAKTESVVITGEHYLQLLGDWTFYASTNWTFKCMPTTHEISHMGNAKRNNGCCWVRAKVKCCDKWLSNTGDGYYWVPNETTVRLNLQQDATQNAFGVPVSFANTHRNHNGIIVKLPVDGDEAKIGAVEIWFSRPFGTSVDYLCDNATLANFEFNVIGAKDLDKRQTNESNTTYESEINNDAVDEFEDISLKLSSNAEKSIRYSQTIRDGYKIMPNTYNVATGNYYLPEQHITSNIATQYATPSVNLQLTLHSGIVTPYTLVTWSKFDGKKFIVNSNEIDYANDTHTVTISEIKDNLPCETTRRDVTRNYRRNTDLIFNSNRLTDANVLSLVNADASISGTFTQTANNACYVSDNPAEQARYIALQPNFENGTLQVSVPNEIDSLVTFSVENRALKVEKQ